ncbi:hypothetical protein FA13DRAFT_1739237 [Coprinellus micaceus]|uniref:NACHT domain-containing protein n=1 Tax=Coprinellus micaceus TaxID=71717 RepID=A0A4Y7ST04_COPMI|nr:hypothetical protein FA13DRAFT_1739237 [Coprinellus micaceus]
MGDYWNSNMYPNDTQLPEQGFSESLWTLPPTVHQNQYYEQGFWEPPQPLPPSNQQTPMTLSMENRVFGYGSCPNRLQPQDSHLGPANQHTHLHGFGHVQPSPPQRWDYNAVTQFPSPSDVHNHALDLNSSVGEGNYQYPQVQHPYQPVAPSRRPGMEGTSEAITPPSFQLMLARNQAHRNAPGRASPYPMPASGQVHRNTSRRASPYPIPASNQFQQNALRHTSSPYSPPYRGQQAGVSQILAPMHSPHIGQLLPPPFLLTQSPRTLGPSQPLEYTTRGRPSPSMVTLGADHIPGGHAEQSGWSKMRPSSYWDSTPSPLFTTPPTKPHGVPQTERTTLLPELPATVNRSHPMPGFSSSHIQEANFTSVGGSYNDHRRVRIQNYNLGPESDTRFDPDNHNLLDELRKQSSLGAVSYAEARADAGRCHPVTRVKALNDLEAWSVGKGPWKDVKLLVLTGPAGHGKSCIMQTFADRLLEKAKGGDPHPVIATFFFKSTVPEQNQPKALVTTLAHQIAAKHPFIQHRIATVIRGDSGIFSTSLEHQTKCLLVDPISGSCDTSSSPSLNVAFAVDGLDECDGDEAQSRVICLLHTLSTIPNTRVVLASRPEFPIQSVIKSRMSGLLHIDLNKDYNAGEDIRQFTWVRLLDIRKRLLPTIDRVSWPREQDAEQIAECASGQFILAEIAMRYVDDRRYDPRKRLEEVLALCRGENSRFATRPVAASHGSTRPLGALDALFTGILERAARNAYPDLERQIGLLELTSLVWILVELIPSRIGASKQNFFTTTTREPIPLWVIEEALNRQSGGLARELSDLHSLLDVPQDMYGHKQISAHHKSLLDFLHDPRRSGHLGNVPQLAKERFDLMIQVHLSDSLTENDVKNLVSAQSAKPHILHDLHRLCQPQTVIQSIGPKARRALLCSLNAWETLLLDAWVHVGLSVGPMEWQCWGSGSSSNTLQMMDAACKGHFQDTLLPGLGSIKSTDSPPISDADVEFLLATLDSQGDKISRSESFAFIPKYRTTGINRIVPSFPWFPAARALAWLWAPSHRLITNHNRDIRPSGTPNVPPQEPSQIMFVVGSAGSGKRELLAETYRLLPAGKESGSPEGWMPPVDIIIIPDEDGLSLRFQWTQGSFSGSYAALAPCSNEDLTGKIDLLHQVPVSLFQDCIASWKARHENNTYHPQFLLQGLHLLLPEHQAALLDVILSNVGPSRSMGGCPLFVTVTSLPTATLASRLRRFSWSGVYYINLDGMKADVSLLQSTLLHQFPDDAPPLKTHKLARILATSPKPARHLKMLIDHWQHDWNWTRWEKRLDPILAAPEPEAWRLIEEHFGGTFLDHK